MKTIHFFLCASLFLAVSACTSQKSVMNQSTQTQALTERLMALWETGDKAELAAIFADDATYDDYPNTQTYSGLQAITGYLTHVHNWASDVKMEVRKIHLHGNSATAEWTFQAVQDRPIGQRVKVATNKTIALNGTTIVEVRNGKIVRAADYIDVLGFVLNLGARVELPGGTVLEIKE